MRVLVLLALTSAASARDSAAQHPARLPADSARHALAEYARRADALGVSGVLLVASGDTVLLHAGLGWRDPAHAKPNDTTTLFYIASIAKQFVAAAILALEEDHRLHTSDELGTLLDNVPPDKQRITLDQLLSHTSGLGRYGFDAARRDWAIEDREHAVRGILATRLTHEPGARFDYQNTNYLLLAAVIERVTGASLETYLYRRLFQPAALRNTYVGSRVTDALRARVAWSVGDESESFSILDRAPSWLWHGRGILMTAGDLYHWLRALDSGAILSTTSLQKLFTIRAPLGPGYGYGAGWFVRADSTGVPRVAFHGGDFGSYHSEIRLYPPSGRVLVALTNIGYRGASITETVLNQMIDVTRGDPDPLPPVARVAGADVAPLAGEYRASKNEGLVVDVRGTSIGVAPLGQQTVDWLTRGDTSAWRDRRDAGERSLALVHALARGDPGSIDGTALLPEEAHRDIASEWAGLERVGGKLKSFQLLGAAPSPDGQGQVAIVRIKLQRDSLLYGVGWLGDTLTYTSPGFRNLVAPVTFAAVSASEWVSYDWSSGATCRLTVVRDAPNAPPRLRLDAARNRVLYVKQ